MPTETLLLIIVAAYALGVLSVLAGILVRHRRSSSRKDYPPKPHPHARRYKKSWRTDTLTWPDQPTKGPSGPAPRPPGNPTPPSQLLTGYQPQRTDDAGTDNPGPPPTGGSGVESAAESDSPVGQLPEPDVGIYRWMFSSEHEYRRAMKRELRSLKRKEERFPDSATSETLLLEAELERTHASYHKRLEIQRARIEQEAREARQREADVARSRPLEDNEVYGMMGHSIHPCNDGEVNRWPKYPPAPPPGEADIVTGSA